jgi:type II secretion system protein I
MRNKGNKGVRTIFGSRQIGRAPVAENSSDPFLGFSLLEVVLALAILAGAFAALGEVIRLANRNAEQARDETQAELLADSVMAELMSGARLLGNETAAFDLAAEPPWVYSIVVEPTEYVELVAVRVRVTQDTTPELGPASCDLIRWLPNPDYLSAAGSETTSSTASSTSSSQSAAGGQR